MIEVPRIWVSPKNGPIKIRKGDVKLFGKGAEIVGAGIEIKKCSGVTLQNVSIRRGARGYDAPRSKRDKHKAAGESLALKRAKNVLLQNVSATWGTDETVSVIDCKDVVFERCLIAHPLDEPKDASNRHLHIGKEPHGYGMLISGSTVWIECCVFAHCRRRCPSVSGDGSGRTRVAMRNCIVYNWAEHGANFNAGGSKQNDRSIKFTIADNLFIPGANTRGPPINIEEPRKNRKLKLHCSGNRIVSSFAQPASAQPVYPAFEKSNDKKHGEIRQRSKFEIDPYNPFNEERTAEQVLNAVGARGWWASPYEASIRGGVRRGTGLIISDESQIMRW